MLAKNETHLEKCPDESEEGRFLITKAPASKGAPKLGLPLDVVVTGVVTPSALESVEFHLCYSLANEIHWDFQLISPSFTRMVFKHF